MNIIIQLFLSSKCFENLMFIIKKSIMYGIDSLICSVVDSFMQVLVVYQVGGCARYSFNQVDCLHKHMENIQYKGSCTI